MPLWFRACGPISAQADFLCSAEDGFALGVARLASLYQLRLVSFAQQRIGYRPVVGYARPWLVTKVWAKAHHVPRRAAQADLQPFLGITEDPPDHSPPRMAKMSAAESKSGTEKKRDRELVPLDLQHAPYSSQLRRR